MAPRLRGSITPSRATISGSVSAARASASRSSGWAYAYAGSCRATPWCTAPPVSRSSSARVTSSSPVPRSAASLRMSRSRSSRSAPSATYAALTGISAVIASSTALRPATHSGPEPGRPVRGPLEVADRDRAAGLLGLVRRVVRPVLGLGRRALALQPAADPAAGPGRVALALAPDGALALAVPRHVRPSVLAERDQRGPAAVSETSTPRAASASRMASAAAKSRRSRASCRWASSAATSPSTTASELPVGTRSAPSTGCRRSAPAPAASR